MATFICSGCDSVNMGNARRVTTSGQIRTMWGPPSIRALVFKDIQSAALFSQQVQIKCFPFRGALADDTVGSELSDKLLCMAVIVFCGNTAVMNLGAEAVGFVWPL